MKARIFIFKLFRDPDGSDPMSALVHGTTMSIGEVTGFNPEEEVMRILSYEFPNISEWIKHSQTIDENKFAVLCQADKVRPITLVRELVQFGFTVPGIKAVAFLHLPDDFGRRGIQEICSAATRSMHLLEMIGQNGLCPINAMHDGNFTLWWDGSSNRDGWVEIESKSVPGFKFQNKNGQRLTGNTEIAGFLN